MNWSWIILGLVALSSVTIAENSYLVIVPKLLKVGYDNQLSVFIATASQPVEVKFELTLGQNRIISTTTVKPGETRNCTLTLPTEFPVGPGELTIVGTGGVRFEEKRDIIVYDNRYVVLVQTSTSTYRPGDVMELRVVATNEELIPIETGEVRVEIYDSNLNLIGEFPSIPIRTGLTETIKFPLSRPCNIGTWLISAIISNTTSSIEVSVNDIVTPSFDLKALFQRFLLRTDKTLRGTIEIDNDGNEPIFGRGLIAIGQITEQDVKTMMKEQMELNKRSSPVPPSKEKPITEEWRKWKSKEFEIAGQMEINYDLLSLFNVDVTKALAVQVYIQVTELSSGKERFIQHIIPIFTRDVIYDIRPLGFEPGVKNEFEIIAKRPDGKPAKMEDLIVTVTMMLGNEQGRMTEEKIVEVKDFYTRGRTDIGLFSLDIPEKCIGLLMTITPLSEDGKVRGYRTHAIPLMPTPRRNVSGGKLSIELLPPTTMPLSTDPNTVVSSQISTVGRTSNFYIQMMPSKPVEKFERLPMSYVLLTNGRITLTGEFTIEPTKECQTKTVRTIRPEVPSPPTCVFNGTLPIKITREMMPYSTLLVYTFQPSFGFHVAELYRFSVAGLFPNPLTLNATIVPYTVTNTKFQDKHESNEDNEMFENVDMNSVSISERAQGKSRVELSFTGTPDSTVGLNVIEYDGVIQGLPNEITKERLLQYLTTYEQVPIVGMPTVTQPSGEEPVLHPREVRPEDLSAERFTPRKLEEFTDSERLDKRLEFDRSSHSSMSFHRSESHEDHSRISEMAPEVPPAPEHSAERMVMTERFGSAPPDYPSLLSRSVPNKEEVEDRILRERMKLKIRYPIEKMVFGISSTDNFKPMEGDDIYTTPNLGRLYGDVQNQGLRPHYRRRGMKSNQYDVTVNDNDYVVATSVPVVMKAPFPEPQFKPESSQPGSNDVPFNQQGDGPQYGTPAWYEKINSKLSLISQEAFTFMQSGLSVVTDFPSLRVPVNMRRSNLTELFSRYRTKSMMTYAESFSIRDEARQLLEEYITENDLSMAPPPIMLEEQARSSYYRSLFFNTSRIESQGTGKIVLPQTKPYSTWIATGFALNSKSGLSVAQPVRLPTNRGLFILANFPEKVKLGEHVLLTYGINNYLGKDLTNVIVRIRASADFDLIEQTQPDRVASNNGKDYTITIPSLRSLDVQTRNIVLVPKRAGVVKILLEVESEFGGDFELLTTFVCESGIKRKHVSAHLFDLTTEKKYGPIVEKITPSPFLRSVKISVSGTGLDRLVYQHTLETSSLVGIDRSIIRLWRALGLRRYLNETLQTKSPLFEITKKNLTTAYQKLQIFEDGKGLYSFISDQGEQYSSLYLTSLTFGALISPFMPVHDYVTINRTLSWILSKQQEDGSFDDSGPCFHYRFCSGQYRREALTALVLYTMTRNNISEFVPEFVRHRLYEGERSPIVRAQRYLESRLDVVKPCVLTTTLIEFALIQCRFLPEQLRQKIYQDVRSRQLTVVPEDNTRFLKVTSDKFTIDDEILLNSLTLSIYATLSDWKTTSDIARWVVKQIERHPHYDTVLDAIFRNEAWLMTDCLFRRQFESEKFSVIIDVTADNGQKQQFKIDPTNMDITQQLRFKLPVNQITYTVSGFGIAGVCIKQVYIEKQQQPVPEIMPFQLTNEFVPMPWLSEIKARTCLTYTPTVKDKSLVKDTFNRTFIIEVQIPSGMRLNLRQIGFFLSQTPEVMYYTYNHHSNKLNFFLSVPSTVYGKPICLEWCLERLSLVTFWAPIEVRVYDYLEHETQLVRLLPIQLQPNLLGWSFVEAVHKARPTLEELVKLQQQPSNI